MLRTLGKYELLSEVGHGGMATVYRARDTILDRLVAVKILHPHLQRTPEIRERFAREARSIAKLKHPYILEVYDYGEHEGETYIVTELLTGPTLREFVTNLEVDVPAEVTACFGIQLARALGEAHQKGIIHRDVKPENVLLHEDRCVKLTDFGIARLAETQHYTATGQILGSPGHMAPEQVEGQHCDERSDVFSLGTVLYFVATGRLPFVGRNAHHLIKQLMEGAYPDPLRVRPAIGGTLRRIIVKALERQPDDRYQHAIELEQDLEAFLDTMDITDPDETLQAFLAKPRETAAVLEERAVVALLRVGAHAVETGDIRSAQDSYSRVLALDEGNETALTGLAKLSQPKPSWMRWAGGAAGLLGVALMAFFVLQPSEDHAAGAVNEPSASAPASEPVPTPAPEPAPTPVSESETAPTPVSVIQPDPAPAKPLPATRVVVFQPAKEQGNFSISVDGAKPRPYGPDFRQIELSAGKSHKFVFEGPENCCETLVERKRIPPGTRPFPLRVALKYKPARVYLAGTLPPDASAKVILPHGSVKAPSAREIFKVPMRVFETKAKVQITAPGYKPYSREVRLRAGASPLEHKFKLEPLAQTP